METRSVIPEKLFFRIGEVCDLIKVQPHVLRYWESEFPMLTPQKNRAGQRVYRRRDVEMVVRIHNLLYEEKFTIAGAKKRLMDETRRGGSRNKAEAEAQVIQHSDSSSTREASSTAELTGELTRTEASTKAELDPKQLLLMPVHEAARPSLDRSPSRETSASASAPTQPVHDDGTRQTIAMVRRGLEDLLTLLGADVSIEN